MLISLEMIKSSNKSQVYIDSLLFVYITSELILYLFNSEI